LKIKHLLDVGKALKIKGFSDTEKPPKSYRKATEKDTEKHQTVENQALAEIFSVFRFFYPNIPQDPPPPLGTIFACHPPVFSIHFSITEKTEKQKTKNKEKH